MAKHAFWMMTATLAAIAGLVGPVDAWQRETTLACDKREVRYRPPEPAYDTKVAFSESKEIPEPHAMKDKKSSPQGTRWLVIQNADFSKPGPWTTTAFVGGVGLNDRRLKLSFIDHASGGVHVQWLNEKLLFVEVWWGRIVATDFILDVNDRKFLYKETAEYGDLIQPCN